MDIFDLRDRFKGEGSLQLANRVEPIDPDWTAFLHVRLGTLETVARNYSNERGPVVTGPKCSNEFCESILTIADRFTTCDNCVREGKY